MEKRVHEICDKYRETNPTCVHPAIGCNHDLSWHLGTSDCSHCGRRSLGRSQ